MCYLQNSCVKILHALKLQQNLECVIVVFKSHIMCVASTATFNRSVSFYKNTCVKIFGERHCLYLSPNLSVILILLSVSCDSHIIIYLCACRL